MGQGSRGDEPCPDCGKKNCPGKDGKEVNEGSCSGNADKDERKEDEEKVEEAAKPDFIDLDGDGDKEESMKKAAADKKADKGEEKEDKKEKQDESFRDSVRKLMEEIIGLQ